MQTHQMRPFKQCIGTPTAALPLISPFTCHSSSQMLRLLFLQHHIQAYQQDTVTMQVISIVQTSQAHHGPCLQSWLRQIVREMVSPSCCNGSYFSISHCLSQSNMLILACTIPFISTCWFGLYVKCFVSCPAGCAALSLLNIAV